MASPLKKPNDEDMITSAETFKMEGNEYFKSKNLKKAMGKYHRAILQLKGVGSDEKMSAVMGLDNQPSKKLSPQLEEKFNKLKTDCYNNLAACLLQEKEPNYSKIVEYCDEVLQVSPGNIKAQHRKGVALYHLKKYEESMSTLQKADQTDSSTKKYLQMCKKAIEKQDIELQATYKAMFRGTSKSNSSTSCDNVNGLNSKEINQNSSADSINGHPKIKEIS
ncbi:tetratricopeptide repeat protein 9C-like [Saccostrea cucullata]|uniref:tetratricopeptide repeat protein 9C-like n=1 Tax=Saccostrea cuccullata TaxID=36930 RepID=UPI002ED10658